MNDPSRNQHIEQNFNLFTDKYLALFTDIQKGLSTASQQQQHLDVLNALIHALEQQNFGAARTQLLKWDMEPLLDTQFDNLKLNADLASLRVRLANLGLLEADTSHYL